MREIDAGSFGKIYKCKDLSDVSRPLVIKIDRDLKLFQKEIKTVKKISKHFMEAQLKEKPLE